MKKDIKLPVVKDVFVAIIPEKNEGGFEEWNAYLINNKNDLIEGVLVSTTGYGVLNGEKKKTATFRHSLNELESKTVKKIESIPEELFTISNEFWVSYFVNKQMEDKKFIFLAETIHKENFSKIPVINKMGVLI